MREESCTTGALGGLFGKYESAAAPTVTLYNCGIQSGVSGSPVLNANGEVVAITQIGPKQKGLKFPQVPGLDVSEFTIDTFGVATNLSCVNIAELGLVHPAPGCDVEGGRGDDDTGDEAPVFNPRDMIKATIKEYARFISAENSGVFGWELRLANNYEPNDLFRLEILPSCVLRLDDPDSLLKQNYREGGYFGWFAHWASFGSIDLIVPRWSATARLDKFGRMSVSYKPSTRAVTYAFNPRAIARLKPEQNVGIVEKVGLRTTDLSLPLCPMGFRSQDIKVSTEIEKAVDQGDDKALDEIIKKAAIHPDAKK